MRWEYPVDTREMPGGRRRERIPQQARGTTLMGGAMGGPGASSSFFLKGPKAFSIVFSIGIPAIHSLNSPIQIQVWGAHEVFQRV